MYLLRQGLMYVEYIALDDLDQMNIVTALHDAIPDDVTTETIACELFILFDKMRKLSGRWGGWNVACQLTNLTTWEECSALDFNASATLFKPYYVTMEACLLVAEKGMLEFDAQFSNHIQLRRNIARERWENTRRSKRKMNRATRIEPSINHLLYFYFYFYKSNFANNWI